MSSIVNLRHQLDSITRYLTPLLPLANCHMVEFFTQNHWDRLMPGALRSLLDRLELDEAVELFWKSAGKNKDDTSELGDWIHKAQSHCITVNNEYCLSVDQLEDKIKAWGGEIEPELRVKEFMTNKKTYEVQTMSRLVASLHRATSSTCCVEAGGGRGHLPSALCLGYSIPSLTIDCDEKTLISAMERVKIIQKQWHAIARKVHNGTEESITKDTNNNLHRFAKVYITKETELCDIVKEKFPEYADRDVKLLLTGLHTCGNLGPDSLRLYTANRYIAGVFNVPCCYHLLTEKVDVEFFDVFQKNYGDEVVSVNGQGFPMSEHLRGYNLGRNARMLAAQSIDRVVHEQQLPSKSLLYRALLQAIVKKHLPDVKITEGKLKRISSKCQNFEQYFKMADDILKLDLYDRLYDSYLTDLNEDIGLQWKRLVMFYLIRLCLAQVVESAILLDRLLFLFENGFENVYLVKLFDPVLSPRCHSFVSVR